MLFIFGIALSSDHFCRNRRQFFQFNIGIFGNNAIESVLKFKGFLEKMTFKSGYFKHGNNLAKYNIM